jgi:WD40 repeat protein
LGVTLTPKFIFGCNGHIRNNLFIIDEGKRLLYSAGHNVVLYTPDEGENGQQTLLPGSDSGERINFINISPSERYLAICERGERAQCSIWDLNNKKKKKVIPENPADIDHAQEFLSAAFSSKNEKSHLITLVGEPFYHLILWQWDTCKPLAKIQLYNSESIPKSLEPGSSNFMLSI